MSQPELGQIIGTTGRAIGNYENEVRKINQNIISKLADFFNVSSDYLLGNSTDRKGVSKIAYIPLLGIVKARL